MNKKYRIIPPLTLAHTQAAQSEFVKSKNLFFFQNMLKFSALSELVSCLKTSYINQLKPIKHLSQFHKNKF